MQIHKKFKNKIKNLFVKYDLDARLAQIDNEFSKIGFNFSKSEELVNQIIRDDTLFNMSQGTMISNHWHIFAGIGSNFNGDQFSDILEIGTYDGVTTTFLAQVFKNAIVETYDLPEDDTVFKSSYNRDTSSREFTEKRNELIQRSQNIRQINKNSFFLTFIENKKYDLIWVDGAHGYPTVVSDIVNSYRLVKPGGFLIIDDVITDKLDNQDELYMSEGAILTLRELISLGAFEKYSFPLKRSQIISADRIFNNKKIFIGQKVE